MNTKNKIIAILMASVMAMAVGMPMAIGSVTTSASVGDVDPTYSCTATVAGGNEPGSGSNGQVDFELVVTDLNGAGDISEGVGVWTAVWNSRTTNLTKSGETATSKTFEGSDTILYCTAPNTYTVTFTGGCTDTFDVGSYQGLNLNFNKTTFSGDANTTNNLGTAYMGATLVPTPTVTSVGNILTDVGVEASDLTKGGDIIAGNNMEATVGTATPDWKVVKPKETWNKNLGCDASSDTAYRLDIPAGTPSGTYGGSLTISVENI